MRKQKRFQGSILLALILLVCYLLFFSIPTVKEPVLVPAWALDLETAAVADHRPAPGEVTTGFRLGDRFGYVNGDGVLYFLGRVQYDVAMSGRGFINYFNVQSEEQSLVFFDSGGDFIASYQSNGYPQFNPEGSRLFILRTDGMGVREIDSGGELLWELNFPAVITTLAMGDDLICLGFADGLLQVYDRSGELVHEYDASGSRINIVVGCAIDPRGERIALVCGLDPQILVYLEKDDQGYRETVITELEPAFRREVYLRFNTDASSLFVESEGQLLHYKISAKKIYSLVYPGSFRSQALSGDGELFSILSLDAGFHSLQLLNEENFLLGRDHFAGDHPVNLLGRDHIILGLGDQLLKYDIMEM